jgi:hypothetical protein
MVSAEDPTATSGGARLAGTRVQAPGAHAELPAMTLGDDMQHEIRTWFAVEYGTDEGGWEDTYYGDRLASKGDAERFIDRHIEEFEADGNGLRIVRRTEQVLAHTPRRDRCAKHPEFERDYCPGCGTAVKIQ